jgi:hypothetical protein
MSRRVADPANPGAKALRKMGMGWESSSLRIAARNHPQRLMYVPRYDSALLGSVALTPNKRPRLLEKESC